MTFDQVFEALKAKFPSEVLGKGDTKPEPFIEIAPAHVPRILLHLRDAMHFETLGDLSAVDQIKDGKIAVVYHSVSYTHRMALRLKAFVPREGSPSVPSVVSVFKAANWLEREVFDMFGVRFENHPDLRRILCPEDWTGFPLRKDYVTPDYYNGMPVPLYFDAPEAEGATKEGHA